MANLRIEDVLTDTWCMGCIYMKHQDISLCVAQACSIGLAAYTNSLLDATDKVLTMCDGCNDEDQKYCDGLEHDDSFKWCEASVLRRFYKKYRNIKND